MVRPEYRRFWLLIAGATVAIMLGCWLSSGTVAPYGTYSIEDHCRYRFNGDHIQFTAVFEMLKGEPSVVWSYSVVLRRVLHPLLAYPFMRGFGFEAGGLIFNILLHGAMLVGFAVAIRRYFDARAAVLVCWLLATYPGYAYWAGLPYSYALIVPGSIACAIGLLWWNDRPSLARTAIAASTVGFVGTGYDLLPYFGGALLILIVLKRRWRDLPIALGVLLAWALFISIGIAAIFGFPPKNSNTQTYGNIVDAWLHFWKHTDGWGSLLLGTPRVFLSNFFFSTGLFLPILFLGIVAHHLRHRVRPVLEPVALSILLATFGVWAFLNFAPPYGGFWQLRGTWVARLYQPWFVVILLVVAAASVSLRDTPRYKLFRAGIIACCLAGALAIAGPYVRVFSVYKVVHQNFYQDASLRKNKVWMRKWGVRPYGVCR